MSLEVCHLVAVKSHWPTDLLNEEARDAKSYICTIAIRTKRSQSETHSHSVSTLVYWK